MNFKHLFGMTGILCATALMSSCATTSSDKNADNVKEHNTSYQAKGTAAVSNDIKTILMAGGLDASNPSSPTATTRATELARASNPAQNEVDALVASLSVKQATTGNNKGSPLSATNPVNLAQKLQEPAKADVATPSTALALVKPQETVTEEHFRFPDIGPNLKPGQASNTETVATVMPTPKVPATPAVKPTPQKFQYLGQSIKKGSRANTDVVYAKPSVERF